MPTYNYVCFNSSDRSQCEFCCKNGMVQIDELDSFTCPNNGSDLKHIGQVSSVSIKTPTRNRFLDISRKQRNKEHFKKEVLPTITDKDSVNHHIKKIRKNTQ